MKQLVDYIALSLFLSLIVTEVIAQSASDSAPANTDIKKLTEFPIENMFQLGSDLYSGAGPDSASDFQALRKLGVKTVISVDGAVPHVELAKAQGLRYVHVPMHYSGLSEANILALQYAMQHCERPIFVHCHHGKHRGPTATSVCAIAAGKFNTQQAADFMKLAGTSPKYGGLWKQVREFDPRTLKPNLKEIPLPEAVQPQDLTASMVRIEKLFSKLTNNHSATTLQQPEELITLLTEEFQESARLRVNDDKLRTQLEATATQVKILSGNSPNRFQVVRENCQACHAKFR